MLIQIHGNLKLIEKSLGGHGQKWVRPLWSWDSQIAFVSIIGCNKLVFCMLIQTAKLKVSMIFGWVWSKMGMSEKCMIKCIS